LQGHLSRNCPKKGQKKNFPAKPKARTTETAESSDSDKTDAEAEEDEIKSQASDQTMVSRTTAKIQRMIAKLDHGEKEEMFDQFMQTGF